MLFYVFILLFGCFVAFTRQCNLLGVEDCHNSGMVSTFQLHAFIPKDQYEKTCRDLNIGLDCIYQPTYMDGCDNSTTFLYDMNKAVVNEVCGSAEYLKHAECLGDANLKDRITNNCLDTLSDGDSVHCQTLMDGVTCIMGIVMDKCGMATGYYMELLAYRFFTPFARIQSCTLNTPQRLRPTTTVITTTDDYTTTMATKMTASMENTTASGGETTTPESGAGRASASLLMLALLVSCALWLR